MSRLQYQFNWRITLFSIACVAVFLHLALWQLQRASEKQSMQDAFDGRRLAPSLDLAQLEIESSALNGQNVRLRGNYLVDQSFLLDNRVLDGKVGFEVISPLLTHDQHWDLVLVNRGWIEMGRTRDEPVDIEMEQTEVDSTGSIYVAERPMYSLHEDTFQGWPALIQHLDVSLMATRYSDHLKVFPYIVRLDEGEPGAYPRFWPVINMRPEKHTAYAVQWLLMAIAVIAAYSWVSFRRQDRGESG